MNIEYVSRELHPTDELKERVARRLEKVEARLHQKVYVRVKFGQEGEAFTCSVHFNARQDYNATGQAADLFKAADDALTKIERQVSRSHDKTAAHRSAGLP